MEKINVVVDHYHVVIDAKKPPMCQIMRFSLYCINGAIEGRHIY